MMNNIYFNNPRTNGLFKQKRAVCFEVPVRVALDPNDVFNTDFISVFLPAQVYETSANMTNEADPKMVYIMNKPDLVSFNRQMLAMMFSEVNKSIKVHYIRGYIELDNAIGDADNRLFKTTNVGETKSIYAIQEGGYWNSLTHDQLAALVADYPIQTAQGSPVSGEIILDSELQAFLSANGYNLEEGV